MPRTRRRSGAGRCPRWRGDRMHVQDRVGVPSRRRANARTPPPTPSRGVTSPCSRRPSRPWTGPAGHPGRPAPHPVPRAQRPEHGRVDTVGHVRGRQAQLPHLRLAVPAHRDRLRVRTGIEHLVPAGHRLAVHRGPHRCRQTLNRLRVETPRVIQDQQQARVRTEKRAGVRADHIVAVRGVTRGQAPEPVPRARRPLQPRHARDHHIPAELRDPRDEQTRLRRVPGPPAGWLV